MQLIPSNTYQSAQQAIMAISEAWQQNLPAQFPAISGRSGMKRGLASLGFELINIQGSLEDLLRLDAPVILEMTLPNVAGKRFLTIYQVQGGELRTMPALTESGWLTIAELRQIWFGKALLPYRNYQAIPLIDLPNQTGKHITAVQKLLAQLPGVELSISNSYDRQTIEVVTQFQRQMDLAPDGRVGAHTLYWLYRLTNHRIPHLQAEGGS